MHGHSIFTARTLYLVRAVGRRIGWSTAAVFAGIPGSRDWRNLPSATALLFLGHNVGCCGGFIGGFIGLGQLIESWGTPAHRVVFARLAEILRNIIQATLCGAGRQ